MNPISNNGSIYLGNICKRMIFSQILVSFTIDTKIDFCD